jgi:hypothetical protein
LTLIICRCRKFIFGELPEIVHVIRLHRDRKSGLSGMALRVALRAGGV